MDSHLPIPQKTGNICIILDLISKFAVRAGKMIQEGWVDLVGYICDAPIQRVRGRHCDVHMQRDATITYVR